MYDHSLLFHFNTDWICSDRMIVLGKNLFFFLILIPLRSTLQQCALLGKDMSFIVRVAGTL